MKFIRHSSEAHTRATSGGKACALAELEAAGLMVPPWFAVTPAAFDASPAGEPAPDVQQAIRQALEELPGTGASFAVRSSARDEDGAQHSFAGQLESFLNVSAGQIAKRVADVWRSGFTERVIAYRREHGLDDPPAAPAVIVQRMVDADCAGVAFSADPVSGRRGIAVVSAVRGLGDVLVSGEADADTFRIDRNGIVIDQSHAEAGQPSLTPDEAAKVAALARRAEAYFGRPQDIEWALADGELFLLQSRPITTLSQRHDPDGVMRVWDNSNIAESYGGLTLPLTYTFARRAYEEVYRQFCRILQVSEPLIEQHADTFRCMIGFIRGRVYYNLVSWHQVLAMLPGYQMNRGFMEQMMGVKEPLPEQAFPKHADPSPFERLRDGFRLTKSVIGLIRAHWTLPRQIIRFYERLNAALAMPRPPLQQMRPDELAAHYRALERQLLQKWDAPLVNDFFAMLFHGLLRKLCATWTASEGETLANELIRDQGGIISTEPAARIKSLAASAREHPALLAALRSHRLDAVRRAAPAEFARQLEAYFEKFGDRCLDELKLESLTLEDAPETLLASISAMAEAPERRAPPSAPAAVPPIQGWLRRTFFHWVLRQAKHRVRDRENLRFERTRLFGRVRRVFVELGRRFAADGILNDERDVFYLTVDEVLGFVEGTAATTALAGLVAVRKDENAQWQDLPPPADRFATFGPVNHAQDYCPATAPASGNGDGTERRGLGCCAGVVRGPVRVITDPRGAVINAGEILVAERTDPGWVMLFPSAAGLLVERGSLLSHSAIVSRELGLPGIVSIAGLTTWLTDGDVVEMNGSTGIVRKIPPAA